MEAVLTGGLLFGYVKGYTTLKSKEVPIEIQLQTSAVLGASKLIVDQALPPEPVARAVATGGLFAGGMYVLFNDEKFARWIALGTIASYIADLVVPKKINLDSTVNE